MRFEVITTIGGCCASIDADLGDRHLEVGENLQQKRFERLVGAIDLVDQQHRRAAGGRLQRLQQRPLDEIARREHVMFDPLLVVLAGRFGEADRHHLRGVVPFVDRGGDIEAFVALQADEPAPEAGRQNLGEVHDHRGRCERGALTPRGRLRDRLGAHRHGKVRLRLAALHRLRPGRYKLMIGSGKTRHAETVRLG